MKNADMPAMPVMDNEQLFPLDMERYGSKSASAKFAFGLTKREMMAMHALQGLLAAPDLKTAEPVAVARAAIAYADSIIAELERACHKT